jgi:hypothetical protein
MTGCSACGPMTARIRMTTISSKTISQTIVSDSLIRSFLFSMSEVTAIAVLLIKKAAATINAS